MIPRRPAAAAAFPVGTRVAYTHKWLVSTGSISLGLRRGTVADGSGVLVRVVWDDQPRKKAPVFHTNPIAVDRIHLEAY